ncbi:type I-E CRISPR-associated protein Cas6/Cse3/CasE [Streptomyces sp. NPDC020681]|uniref:type I-E CRISPR-associated protein Cas6/Cse3/CasE n=1 Tax=Streptomyces sp. NPDC020681 TaxID=3365083 RepID=UPI0037B51C38
MTPTATLAQIHLNPQSRAVQRDLRDAAEMHRTLMRLVPDHLGDNPRHTTGLLFRLEETEHTSKLLVQATVPLDPSRLPDGYGRAHVKDLSGMFQALREGLPVRYRITLNPVKRERLPLELQNQRGKIIPLSGPAADQWWTQRAAGAGLQLHSTLPTPQRPAQSQHRTEKPTMRHSLIRYDGTATITDSATLSQAILAGIGRGKSYGAGLLSLAPAHTA